MGGGSIPRAVCAREKKITLCIELALAIIPLPKPQNYSTILQTRAGTVTLPAKQQMFYHRTTHPRSGPLLSQRRVQHFLTLLFHDRRTRTH